MDMNINLFRRACLYVIRKRGKTLILFLLMLALSTMTLTGVVIKDATKIAEKNVREALGGSFTLNQNTSDPAKWVSRNTNQFGSQMYYGGALRTKELADMICSKVEGIKGYNATFTSYAVPASLQGEVLKLIESEDGDNHLAGLMTGNGDFNQTVTTLGNTNTQLNSYFNNGFVRLSEGRHLTNADQNAVLLGKEFAQQNGLSVGDQIILRQAEFKAAMNGLDVEDTKVEVEIIGLFEITGKGSSLLGNWSIDNTVFTTFHVIQTVRPEIGAESFEHLDFYANDPVELDRILTDIKNLEGLDWTDFQVDVDTSSMDSVLEPLKNMERLITILITIMLLIGAAILYLVLAGRVKERIHESGILLSIGIDKNAIVFQYITEIILIALFAFGLSYFSSGLIAQSVGDQLLSYNLLEDVSSLNNGLTNLDGQILTDSDAFTPQFNAQKELTRINVSVGVTAVVILYLVGFLIIIVSVILASLPVYRLKPKELLTKMS